MGKNLFDFGSENIEESLHKIKDENRIDDNTAREAETIFNKYKDFSQDELISEFLKTSREKLKNGALSMEGLNNTIENLSPFLNNDQKNFFKRIVRKD